MKYTVMKLKLIHNVNGLASVPLDNDGLIKRFLFRCDNEVLESVFNEFETSDDLKLNVMSSLVDNFYFLDFLACLGFDHEILIAAINFEFREKTYDFSYMNEDFCDDYWICEPKIKLAEDFGRESAFGYAYDEYSHYFGMDEENR